jgi:hypothetical protein
MDAQERVRFLEANLGRQLAWIGAADSRSAFIFAVDTAMLGLLAAVAPRQAASWGVAPAVFASFATVFVLASLLFITFASFPRVEGPRGSLVFFRGITQRTTQQFKDAVAALSDESYADDLVNQCYRNAEIASRKFSWVQRSLICLYLAVPPWGLAIYLLYNAGAN